MIKVTVRGDFKHILDFGDRVKRKTYLRGLARYGPIGVAALKAATPEDSGETSESWYYEIIDRPGYYSIHWLNSNVEDPGTIPVAVLIQYGHATRNGGFVQGTDYINPAMKVIFDQIASDMWREVTR